MARKAKEQRPIGELVAEYSELTKQEKIIKSRKEELSKLIKEHATNHGVKSDTGSYYAEVDNFTYGSQARKSIKLNQEKAKTFFVARGLWTEVVDIKEVINEDKISKLVEDEKITFEELEGLTDVSITYAIDVKPKEKEQKPEDMPEVQVVSAKKGLRKI